MRGDLVSCRGGRALEVSVVSETLCSLVKTLERQAQFRNLRPIGPAFCRLSTYRRRPLRGARGVCFPRPIGAVKRLTRKLRSLAALRGEVFLNVQFKLPELCCHHCHGFATRHSRYRLGHHVREGRLIGGCTRPPIRVRSVGELRPGCEGRDRERGGRVPGEAAPWSRRPGTTLGAFRATPFREEVPLIAHPVVPPRPAALSSRAPKPAAAQAKPLDFVQGLSHLLALIFPRSGFSRAPDHGAGFLYSPPITFCTLS